MDEKPSLKKYLIQQFKHFGVDDRSVDAKGRISLPPAIRDISTSVLLMPYPDAPCIVGCAAHQWDWDQESTDPQEVAALRAVKALSRHVEADSNGRIVLRKQDLEWLEITEPQNIYIIGQGSHFEIWSKDNWAKEQERIVKSLLNIGLRR